MARAREQRNGRLEEAMTTLLQTRAAFLARISETDRELAELKRINAERFARIETILLEHSRILAEHSRILADHSRILAALPDAIREKIDFKIPEQPPGNK